MRCGPVNISVSIHHQRTNKHKDVFLFIINIMPNYSNGKIYKVVNDNLNICYIGSTVQPLSVRMSAHQGHHKSGSFARYKKWGKIEDCKIHLIENYPCKDKHELESRERHFIESYRAGTGCLNVQTPTRTRTEYNQDNRERILQGKKKYRINNADKIKAYRLLTRQERVTCDCGSAVTKHNLQRHCRTQKHKTYLHQSDVAVC